MRTNKYILLAATLLGLSSCGNKRGDYDASGTFEATEVIVSSEANGKIMQFNIEEGQLLKAGEEVGCIDTAVITSEYNMEWLKEWLERCTPIAEKTEF